MPKTPKEKPTKRLALLICPPKPDFHHTDIQTFMLGFVTIENNSASARDRVRNPGSSPWDEFHEYSDLKFRAQGPVMNPRADGEVTYGAEVEYYSVYNVDLAEAELMVKMLRRTAKAEKDFPVRPTTFGQYCALMCAALGVRDAVQERGKAQQWHDEADYVFWKATDIQWLVDSMIHDFMQQHGPKLEPVEDSAAA